MTGVDEADIRSVLTSNGITAPEISPVTEGDEPVYRVRSEGAVYFVKVLPDEKGFQTRRVLDSGIEIGLPDSSVLSNGVTVHLMEPAAGRPLSQLLVGLFPGGWVALSGPLCSAFQTVGRYLGRLHSETSDGTQRLRDCEGRLERDLSLDSSVRELLDPMTVNRLNRRLAEARDCPVPRALVHGDTTPHNIYLDVRSGEVDVIDFSFAESVTVEDYVILECGIELMVGRLPYGREAQATALLGAFREGYAQTAPDIGISHEVVETLKTGRYCTMLRDYRSPDRLTGTRARLTRLTDERVIRSKIEAFAE